MVKELLQFAKVYAQMKKGPVFDSQYDAYDSDTRSL